MSTGELLTIEPLELKFTFELKKQTSCSLQLSNKTDNYVAYKVKTTNPKKYCVRPNTGVVSPRSVCDIVVTMQAQKEAPLDMQCKDKFLLQSVIVSQGAVSKDITPEMFSKEAGHVVEECKLKVVYVSPPRPPSPVPEGEEEEGSPQGDDGHISGSDSVAASRNFGDSQDRSTEANAIIAKLTEEKKLAIQQNNELRQELNQQRGDKRPWKRRLLSTTNVIKNAKVEDREEVKERIIDLGNGSQVVYNPSLIGYEESWKYFEYLNNHIPWTRPTLRIFGRSCLQPRDTCYIATEGLQKLVYSGYEPHPYSWHLFPPLLQLLSLVQNALPGSRFNSLLLNRYQSGDDCVGWHSDDEYLYGPTPEIASLSFGCDRDFLLKKKKKTPKPSVEKEEPLKKRMKKSNNSEELSFKLKHGSMLVMRGFSQRDWVHSVPKRAKIDAVRINLTFRLVL